MQGILPPLLRIAVVSPSPAVRSGLRALLDGQDNMIVIGERLSPSDDDQGERADVLVGEAGPYDRSEWRDAATRYPVVLLGDPAGLAPYRSALTAGFALLLRESSGPEIAAAVVGASRGLAVFDPALVERRFTHEVLSVDAETVALTPRELEILRLVAAGLPNKTIARELSISDHTVKFHIGSAMDKLGAASRAEAVALAIRNGLLPL